MILDIHHHAIQINGKYSSSKELKFMDWKIAFFYKTWLKMVGLQWNDDVHAMNEDIIAKQVELIENSMVDHFVMLPLDACYSSNGVIDRDKSVLYVDNQKVVEISKRSKKIIPAFSINPRRPDAYEQLEEAAHQGAALIKWLPGIQGIDPTSKVALRFVDECAKKEIPMLIHYGQEFSFPGQELFKQYHRLQNVETLLRSGCKIIVPHFGGFAHILKHKRHKYLEYLIETYDNVYFDNSATLSPIRKGDMLRILHSKCPILERTFFGTDFPVYSHTTTFMRYLGLKKYRYIKSHKNPINRDVLVKKAIGFEDPTFSNGYNHISKYAQKKFLSVKATESESSNSKSS